ncbi:MAG: HAMP domain-containing histidine kinase [Leptolyngbyaceae cyanobacterium SM2_5_2]|nr:HAMP domain-containing histidine kinase [Leptolyngbyaceae cyanobacterium SM2_5_2]
MSRAEISQFLSHFPSYPLTTTLRTVANAIQLSALPSPSHIVVVDAQQLPLGALAVGRLWAYAEETKSTSQAEVALATPPDDGRLASEGARFQTPGAEPELSHCQPWLEPVGLIPGQASLTEFWAMIQAHPQAFWVVINTQQQYQGVIEASTLVPWLLQQFPPSKQTPATEPTPSSPIPLPSTSTQERTWLMAVGHALNTPLTSLLGLSTLLLDQRIGPLTERQTRYAWLIQQAIRRLTRMINQLVDWMRLDANQIVLGLAPVDLQPFLETLLPTFQASWLAEPDSPPDWMQAFTVTLNPELITLSADRPRLLQSLHGVLNYLLHQGATPGGIMLDWWGSWVGITLWASSPSPEALPAYPWQDPTPQRQC